MGAGALLVCRGAEATVGVLGRAGAATVVATEVARGTVVELRAAGVAVGECVGTGMLVVSAAVVALLLVLALAAVGALAGPHPAQASTVTRATAPVIAPSIHRDLALDSPIPAP